MRRGWGSVCLSPQIFKGQNWVLTTQHICAGLLAYKLGHYRRAAEYLEEYLLRHPDTHEALHIRTYLRTVWVELTRMNEGISELPAA